MGRKRKGDENYIHERVLPKPVKTRNWICFSHNFPVGSMSSTSCSAMAAEQGPGALVPTFVHELLEGAAECPLLSKMREWGPWCGG